MCGIAGLALADSRGAVEAHAIEAMLETLVHRGPDDSGSHLDGNVALGMRRLSIIDIEGGHQPIANEDERIWAVCNGEVYNFIELREELQAAGHRFRTRSDTEVLVHAYEQWGPDFVNRLNGMYALALWDERERRLFLIRDRLGIKPLYWAQWNGRLGFASELKALVAAGLPREVDPLALHHYLSYNYIPAPHCIWKGAHKLGAGHMLVWQDGRAKVKPYWQLGQNRIDPPARVEEAAEMVEALLERSVKRRLVSDVPLGLFLSGGVDSSALACMMAAHTPGRVKTFTADFADKTYSEAAAARQTSELFGTDHHEFRVKMDPAEMLPVLAGHFDEPFADSSAIPVYYLSLLARQSVTVALSGDGADEVFAGYETYTAYKWARFYRLLPGFLTRGLIPRLARRIPTGEGKISRRYMAQRFLGAAGHEAERAHYLWKIIFSEREKNGLYAPEFARAEVDSFAAMAESFARCPSADPVNRLLYVDTSVYLPDDILTKVDRMSMAVSLEARVPFLDHELVEAAFALPGGFKLRGMDKKHVLKRALARRLPGDVLRRRKRGFNVPMARWLRSELDEAVRYHLGESRQRSLGFFQPEAVKRLRREHFQHRRDRSREIWGLLNFSLWHAAQVEGRG